jgi:hypothetical protein
VEMPVRGKHGKPNPGFPPFPPPLEIAQNPRDSHIPTASTTTVFIRTGPKNLPYNHQARGWARLNRRSGPGVVAKRNNGANNGHGISVIVPNTNERFQGVFDVTLIS